MKISDLILTLIAEIQEEANRLAEASRTDTPEGKSSPNLNLERLIQQAQADAEIAGYCTTDKSRKVRRAALVRAGACNLLALFQMEREERCGACAEVRFTGTTTNRHNCRPPMQAEMTSLPGPLVLIDEIPEQDPWDRFSGG